MTISDALVIYLACGSPFGVNVFLVRRGRTRSNLAIGAAVNLILWPFVAFKQAYRLAAQRSVEALDERPESHLSLLLKEMENALNVPTNAISIFDVRDILERYSGLACAWGADEKAVPNCELFEVSLHPDAAIAAACLSRKTRARLARHLDQARVEFTALALQMVRSSDDPRAAASLVIRIFGAVGDEYGRRDMERILNHSELGRPELASAEKDQQIWSTQQPTTIAN